MIPSDSIYNTKFDRAAIIVTILIDNCNFVFNINLCLNLNMIPSDSIYNTKFDRAAHYKNMSIY